ncbi:MAG TPA: hypothetical protein VF331_06610 [Polyangiales bacterium]
MLGWVQQFRVPTQQNLIDLTQGDPWRDTSDVPILAPGLVSTLGDLVPSPTSAWKPEYFIPRFIADCARQAGATVANRRRAVAADRQRGGRAGMAGTSVGASGSDCGTTL